MTNRTTLTETEIVFTNAQRVARLATADVNGHPHIVPVCYAFDGTRFYIPLDEKPKKVDDMQGPSGSTRTISTTRRRRLAATSRAALAAR